MPHLKRLNERMREVVERGILLDVERGTVNAWIFMKENGASEIVMLRVLSRPDKRRESDKSALQYARGDGLPLRYSGWVTTVRAPRVVQYPSKSGLSISGDLASRFRS